MSMRNREALQLSPTFLSPSKDVSRGHVAAHSDHMWPRCYTISSRCTDVSAATEESQRNTWRLCFRGQHMHPLHRRHLSRISLPRHCRSGLGLASGYSESHGSRKRRTSQQRIVAEHSVGPARPRFGAHTVSLLRWNFGSLKLRLSRHLCRTVCDAEESNSLRSQVLQQVASPHFARTARESC